MKNMKTLHIVYGCAFGLTVLTFVLLLFIGNESENVSFYLVEENEFNGKLHKELQALKNKIFNLSFEYTLKSEACEKDEHILGVLVVTSYFGNVETRSSMRRAFSADELREMKLRRVFLLAQKPDSDKYTIEQSQVQDEHRRFNDIVQGNFIEAYKNLTYKHLMGLKWAAEECPHAKYVIKMDDDTVVDVLKLKSLLETIKLPKKNPLAGYVFKGLRPSREPANKWYVSAQEYPGSSYPAFVSGWMYITTPEVSGKLLKLSASFQYFWIDDVFVTGILAGHLRIRPYDLSRYFTPNPDYLECCMRDAQKHRLDCDLMVGPNGGDNNLFLKYNAALRVCRVQHECRERPAGRLLNETCVAELKIPLGRGHALVDTYRMF